jgi:hypothetical protein
MAATHEMVIHELRRSISHALLISALLPVVACGGGSGVAKNTSQNGTNLTVTFANSVFPTAVAEKFGDGAWSAVAVPTTNPLTVVLPQGTTNFGFAYVCPQFTRTSPLGSTQQNDESVIEADVSDGSGYTVTCGDNPPTGTVTGTYSASSLAGSTSVEIYGGQTTYILQPGNSGAVSGSLATSTKDIAVVAIDGKLDPLAIQILRSQSVPGAINGGSAVNLTTANATTVQPLAVSGVPAGFGAPNYIPYYITANGTVIPLRGVGMTSQYAALPSSMSASGDFYRFDVFCGKGVNGSLQQVSTVQSATTGGPITLNLPTPLTVQAPVPAASPSFNLSYSGFSGEPAVYDSADIYWQIAATNYQISVHATQAFQNGSTNVAIPDLTSIPGFLASAPSGTTVSWFVAVSGGSYFPFTSTPTSGSLSSASDSGTYIEP